jgi:fumarate hydratase class II
MVQAPDIAQLAQECNGWREQLRQERSEIGDMKKHLQHVAAANPPKELLTDIEHYHNQFYIQLINIHDLKQAIKNHEQQVQHGDTTDECLAKHEELHSEYENLEHIITDLRTDFNKFLSRSS